MRILIAHPARQRNVYERPRALVAAGRRAFFFTGLYYDPATFPYSLVRFLPRRWRRRCMSQLEKRRIPNFDRRQIVSLGGPWLEAFLRPINKISEWTFCFDWLMARWIRRHGKPKRPALIHCYQGSAFFTVQAAKAQDYLTVVEMTLPSPPPNGPMDPRDLAAMRACDCVLAQSKPSVDAIRRWGIPAGKIVLLPLGVDLEEFHPGPPHRAEDPFRVLFVGQLGKRKGLHHLLEAWKQLALPEAELILVGYPNPEGRELLDRYQGHYHLRGFVPDAELPEVYRSADVFVLPSWAEGAANVVYEALASGLPCIVTENACSIVRDNVDGFIIPWADVESLKTRLRELYENRQRRREMSRSARARAEAFSWEAFGGRLSYVYEAMANGLLAERREHYDAAEGPLAEHPELL